MTVEGGINDVAVVIPTLDEAANIGRTLDSLRGFPYVLVIDSGSSDDTVRIARSYRNVVVVVHPWQGFGAQKNWGARQVPGDFDWILFLDADEWLPPADQQRLSQTLQALPNFVAGVALTREVILMGRVLRGLARPPGMVRAVRRGRGAFESRGVNEHLAVNGEVASSDAVIRHEDLKPVWWWVRRQVDYMRLEAEARYRTTPPDELSGLEPSRRRRRFVMERIWPRLPGRPLWAFLYFWIGRGLVRDSWPGFYYAFQQGVNQAHLDMFYREMDRRRVPTAVDAVIE